MFAIVDIEATGGSASDARMMEIAIVVHNGERVIEEYSTLINPERPIDPFVVALTGISNEMVEDAPKFKDIAEKIEALTKDRIFVAHNASFDYAILKGEFKRLGERFQRKKLCTVKMSQKHLPGQPSYSLGKLCNALDIPIKNRHRALGDASATAVILERILFTDKKNLIESALKDELAEANLPPNISARKVDNLPEEVGVYYFKNNKDQSVYIGKSKNIRKRVLQHFNNSINSLKNIEMVKHIHQIDFVLTGSELVAELLEAGEIKRFMPSFNIAQRRKKYRYGIFVHKDENGYHRLNNSLLNPDEKAVLKFTTKKWCDRAINNIRKENNLFQEQRIALNPDEYNEKVKQAIDRYNFDDPNILIIDKGRNYDEKSVVQIQNGSYVGFGYFSTDEAQIENPQEIIEVVNKDYNNPNKEQIIRKYLRKKKSLTIVEYNPESDI